MLNGCICISLTSAHITCNQTRKDHLGASKKMYKQVFENAFHDGIREKFDHKFGQHKRILLLLYL